MAVLIEKFELYNDLINRKDLDINLQNKNGNSILHLAAKIKNESLQREILKNPKVNINTQNEQQNTALHVAIKENNISYAKMLIKNEKINIDSKNINGMTPLMMAIEKDQNEIVNELLENIHNNDSLSNKLLHIACEKNNYEQFTILIKRGLDYNSKNNTPLIDYILNC